MQPPLIQLIHLSKRYGNDQALDAINLSIPHGTFITILGPSGCGKTTLLRLLAGLDYPDTGKIIMDGVDISNTPPERRSLNMIFQNYALFPHMTVYQNIAFGLRCARLNTADIEQRVQEALIITRLSEYADRVPKQLSGGQQQRVAIARAIVNRPRVLLFDEPFSALDRQLRQTLCIELRTLQKKLGVTFVFVTHDQEEALSMSDQIVVMNHGTIEQIGTPRDIYEEPKNLTVARFIGQVNVFNTVIQDINQEALSVMLEGQPYSLANKGRYNAGDQLAILVRPEDIRVWHENEIVDTQGMLKAKVEQFTYKGSTVDLSLRLESGHLIFATEFFDEDDEELIYGVGESVWINWLPGWEVILSA